MDRVGIDVDGAHFDDAVIQAWLCDWIERQIITEEEEGVPNVPEFRAREQEFGPLWG